MSLPKRYFLSFSILVICLMSGCQSYKQHLMFKYDETYPFTQVEQLVQSTERNYVILPDDYIELEVYTKGGERIIDPDLELNRELRGNNANTGIGKPEPRYLILPDSTAKLPMIGNVKLGGLTVDEATRMLEEKYSEFYNDPYVLLRYTNKRVIVLGAPGGQVISLENENMSVSEVLALAGGININSKSNNIRLIRGEKVFLIDLSTLDGYFATNQSVEAGDILYVEPIPRVITQSASEISLIVSTITALTTLVLLFITL